MDNETEIILVEDNPSDADLTIRALKKCNVTNKILHLKDGQEVLDYIFADGEWQETDADHLPRVILLDLKMPKVNGIDVLRKLKADERTKIIPIVVLTSSKEDPDIKECYRLGVNSYVVKPLAFDEFAKAVSQLGLYWLLINQPTK
ncbi:MAG TPA: response regulator [Chitinophagaceae bacterium]|nr:response regulator [Chitinophagaceae bacterium]